MMQRTEVQGEAEEEDRVSFRLIEDLQSGGINVCMLIIVTQSVLYY
jgi:hypothetical protein